MHWIWCKFCKKCTKFGADFVEKCTKFGAFLAKIAENNHECPKMIDCLECPKMVFRTFFCV